MMKILFTHWTLGKPALPDCQLFFFFKSLLIISLQRKPHKTRNLSTPVINREVSPYYVSTFHQ
jgi:hypothetical protein